MKQIVFIEESSFISSIAENKTEKLEMLFLLSEKRYVNFSSFETLQEITVFIMKKTKKSNFAFLLWLYTVGEHLKEIFKGKWMLEKRNNILGEYFVPLIIDSQNDVWLVGDFCYSLYFNNNRMKNIGFNFFYKVYVERKVSKLNLLDLNIDKCNLIKIE
jgi:hypothetical protein